MLARILLAAQPRQRWAWLQLQQAAANPSAEKQAAEKQTSEAQAVEKQAAEEQAAEGHAADELVAAAQAAEGRRRRSSINLFEQEFRRQSSCAAVSSTAAVADIPGPCQRLVSKVFLCFRGAIRSSQRGGERYPWPQSFRHPAMATRSHCGFCQYAAAADVAALGI